MTQSICPACEAPLDFEPWSALDDGALSPSHEICPSCGIQFGYDDARPDLRELVYNGWRQAWLLNGKQAVDPDVVERPWLRHTNQPS